jgi:hypothetical protein
MNLYRLRPSQRLKYGGRNTVLACSLSSGQWLFIQRMMTASDTTTLCNPSLIRGLHLVPASGSVPYVTRDRGIYRDTFIDMRAR